MTFSFPPPPRLYQIEDLQKKADEVSKLRDQLDEYKHAADKAQRNENVIEKYKKKLEEGADVRRQLKVCSSLFCSRLN